MSNRTTNHSTAQTLVSKFRQLENHMQTLKQRLVNLETQNQVLTQLLLEKTDFSAQELQSLLENQHQNVSISA